ncbi:hypothetical protein KV557_24840 [Kitasatospora aureofaciens]|uniref:hypothetical protein n=1 Tax=Kitasatospora aureofaciens TaxID=1894 RepID=UPI001C46B1C3|nr:hypothetical protein [Kitasatospora aureofaciens]MBV6700293.1 hypothetical protein [Kitasatospora aureofaciens]
MNTSTTTLAYRIGKPTGECRYPVLIGDLVIGWVFRWSRDWFALTSNGEHKLGRPAKGVKGITVAADYVATEYAAGRTVALPQGAVEAETVYPEGEVPLLHPRLAENPRGKERNEESARAADAKLAQIGMRRTSGFPGADNPVRVACELCGWEGWHSISHLRGRNGNPPSITGRHPGDCVGEETIREQLAAYRK